MPAASPHASRVAGVGFPSGRSTRAWIVSFVRGGPAPAPAAAPGDAFSRSWALPGGARGAPVAVTRSGQRMSGRLPMGPAAAPAGPSLRGHLPPGRPAVGPTLRVRAWGTEGNESRLYCQGEEERTWGGRGCYIVKRKSWWGREGQWGPSPSGSAAGGADDTETTGAGRSRPARVVQ